MNHTFRDRNAANVPQSVSLQSRLKAAFLIMGIVLSVIGLVGCLFDYDGASGKSLQSGRPRALALCYDISKSARQLPELTPFLVDTMLSLVRYPNGGEFAFSCIEARKPQLVRLRFEAETGGILEKRRRRELNDRQLSRVRDFVYESISEREAMQSRVFDCIELMLTFLAEPHIPANAERRLVVISDFVDDVREPNRRLPISVPANTTVITIGAEPLTVEQVLTGPGRIIPYSNIDGLVHYLSMESQDEALR